MKNTAFMKLLKLKLATSPLLSANSRRFGNKYHNGGLHHSLVSVTLVDDEGYIVCKKVHRHWEYPYYSQVEKTVKWADWFVGSKQAKYSF